MPIKAMKAMKAMKDAVRKPTKKHSAAMAKAIENMLDMAKINKIAVKAMKQATVKAKHQKQIDKP